MKRKLRPTQAALGWDWVFYKLGNFTSEVTRPTLGVGFPACAAASACSAALPSPSRRAPLTFVSAPAQSEAQHYMAQKPVPYVQRGDRKYIVDHHHTLVALELSGYDPEITMEQVRSFDKNEQSIEAFWVRAFRHLGNSKACPTPLCCPVDPPTALARTLSLARAGVI